MPSIHVSQQASLHVEANSSVDFQQDRSNVTPVRCPTRNMRSSESSITESDSTRFQSPRDVPIAGSQDLVDPPMLPVVTPHLTQQEAKNGSVIPLRRSTRHGRSLKDSEAEASATTFASAPTTLVGKSKDLDIESNEILTTSQFGSSKRASKDLSVSTPTIVENSLVGDTLLVRNAKEMAAFKLALKSGT